MLPRTAYSLNLTCLYLIFSLPGGNPPTVVPEADVVLQPRMKGRTRFNPKPHALRCFACYRTNTPRNPSVCSSGHTAFPKYPPRSRTSTPRFLHLYRLRSENTVHVPSVTSWSTIVKALECFPPLGPRQRRFPACAASLSSNRAARRFASCNRSCGLLAHRYLRATWAIVHKRSHSPLR